MGRLIQAALYRHGDFSLHYIMGASRGDRSSGPTDMTDYTVVWERAARNVRTNDPRGEKSAAILHEMMFATRRRK